jgi:hypothetical protein
MHAGGAVEAYALNDHPMSSVRLIRLNDFAVDASTETQRRYRFDGQAWSENPWIPLRKRWTHAAGNLDLQFDEFGRVRRATATIE